MIHNVMRKDGTEAKTPFDFMPADFVPAEPVDSIDETWQNLRSLATRQAKNGKH